MSLNNININGFYEEPITVWKTKQRVHYRDDVVLRTKKCVSLWTKFVYLLQLHEQFFL